MKVLVADDHPLVRDALARAVNALADQVTVVEAADFAGALRLLSDAADPPDLALVDLHMPGMDGLGSVRELQAAASGRPLVVTSGHDDAATIRTVLACGVAGFVPKTAGAELLMQALRMALGGAVFVPAQVLQPAAPPAALDAAALTPRQTDVLHALARGLPNKLIARELGLTEGTVKVHIAAILRQLQARNRTEAVVRAREQGLLADS